MGDQFGPLFPLIFASSPFSGRFDGLAGGGLFVDPEKEEDVYISESWDMIFRLRMSFSPVEKLEKAWFWPL